MLTDNLNKYQRHCILITSTILFFSCKEKREFKEIIINENILHKIRGDHKPSANKNVYVISLFTNEEKNICEIANGHDLPSSNNFVGCQLLKNDTIFLYIDKKKKFQNCYNLSGKTIRVNKKQFANEQKRDIRYYMIDTLNCKLISK